MEIDFSKLVRDPDRVKKVLKDTGDDVVTKEDCVIIFPSRYINRSLAHIEQEVVLFGVFAVIVEGNRYAVFNIPSFVRTVPWNVSSVTVEEREYMVLHFEKNSTVITTTDLVMNDNFAYEYFDEFFTQAKVPFFLDYEDLVRTAEMLKKYTGSRIGDNRDIISVLASIIARSPDDKKVLYRHYLKKGGKERPAFIPLESVFYSFDNTMNRVLGAYSDQGILASLVEKTEEAGEIEKLLRA